MPARSPRAAVHCTQHTNHSSTSFGAHLASFDEAVFALKTEDVDRYTAVETLLE